MASHLSLVTLGLVGYDLIQSEDYSFRRIATLAIACNSVLALPRRRGEEGGAQGGHGCTRCAGDAPTVQGESRPGACARCSKTSLAGPCRGKKRNPHQTRGATVRQIRSSYEEEVTCEIESK